MKGERSMIEMKEIMRIIAVILLIELPSGYLINFIPARWFKFHGLFKEYSFEAKLYEIIKVKKWKKYLPEGAKVMKNAFDKQHLEKKEEAYYVRFTQELCRAEVLHWFHLLLLLLVFSSSSYWIYIYIYVVVSNVPCIIAQRYNRPRLLNIIKRLKKRA